MKFPFLLVTFLVAIASVSAAPAYWTVFDDAGAASDVVNGANFAASMKATVGVSFTGMTESQATASNQDVDDLFVVRLHGTTAEISYGTDNAFDEVADVARTYLRDQGFSVTVSDTPQENREAPTRAPPTTAPTENPTPKPKNDVIENANAVLVPPPQPLPTPVADPQPQAPEPEVEEQPGFFTRLWTWFVDIFS
jgi:hypothetical protein